MHTLSVCIEVRFKLDDAEADATLASSAYCDGWISQETAICMFGLVSNAEEELEEIKGSESETGSS